MRAYFRVLGLMLLLVIFLLLLFLLLLLLMMMRVRRRVTGQRVALVMTCQAWRMRWKMWDV